MHLRRERAEIMQTRDNEWDFLPQFEHLVNHGRAQPVAQLDGIESEIENLPDDVFVRICRFPRSNLSKRTASIHFSPARPAGRAFLRA